MLQGPHEVNIFERQGPRVWSCHLSVSSHASVWGCARDLPHFVSIFCSLAFPVPAAVTNLRITENSTRHLSFSWTTSEGELSWYNIFLYNPDRTLQERAHVDPQVQTFSFQNLLQGRMYKVVIVTHSGELSNESFIFGRTGKTRTQAVRNSGAFVSYSLAFP